jgi:hypothetical protein
LRNSGARHEKPSSDQLRIPSTTIAAEDRQNVAEKGHSFPNGENLGTYPTSIAYALRNELGTTHQATKIVMGWTGAGERTVKNWLAGNSGPNGQHLVDLIRHSDRVLEVLLVLAGRQQIAAAQRLLDVRNKLAETVELVDTLMGEGNCTR